MKFEALMLRSLCAIGMLVCALVLGAMLLATPATAGDKMTANAAQATFAACPQMVTAAVSPPTRS